MSGNPGGNTRPRLVCRGPFWITPTRYRYLLHSQKQVKQFQNFRPNGVEATEVRRRPASGSVTDALGMWQRPYVLRFHLTLA